MNAGYTVNRIQILSETVKNKISAGEVVEGPFSVVKELIENSLDAGAGRIEIQVLEAGMKRISITDDGRGIHPEDLELTVMEHATSKISDIHDIESIHSYGFRGEALSSISSISNMSLLTRQPEDDEGGRIDVREGKLKKGTYAGASGTTVIVENLFYNVPARKKFMKAQRTEMKYIRETVLKAAVVNPEVTFRLETDGKQAMMLQGTDDHEERIRQVYGTSIMKGLYHETITDLKVSLTGFLSRPDFLKGTRSAQLLFINGRPIEYKYLGFLLSRAYEAVAPKGKYPMALLFLTIDPELIDVNIHPAKREVKLFDQRYIDSLIINCAAKALDRDHEIREEIFRGEGVGPTAAPPVVPVSSLSPGDYDTSERGREVYRLRDREASPQYRETSPEPAPPQERHTSPEGELPLPGMKELSGFYKEIKSHSEGILGTVFDTYVLAEREGALYFIDFHAAHERFIFDRLMTEEGSPEKQELLMPEVVELSLGDYQLVLDNLSLFSEIGFDMEDFSDKSIMVRAVPAHVRKLDVEAFVTGFIEELNLEKGTGDGSRAIAASAACHQAKRAGDTLTGDDMKRLIEGVFGGDHELRCPHGRPFVHKISRDDLERIFKRS